MVQIDKLQNVERIPKGFKGQSGSKICIKLNGIQYLVKFPGSVRDLVLTTPSISYTNSPVSEILRLRYVRIMSIINDLKVDVLALSKQYGKSPDLTEDELIDAYIKRNLESLGGVYEIRAT